jgi:hypothetical protein
MNHPKDMIMGRRITISVTVEAIAATIAMIS